MSLKANWPGPFSPTRSLGASTRPLHSMASGKLRTDAATVGECNSDDSPLVVPRTHAKRRTLVLPESPCDDNFLDTVLDLQKRFDDPDGCRTPLSAIENAAKPVSASSPHPHASSSHPPAASPFSSASPTTSAASALVTADAPAQLSTSHPPDSHPPTAITTRQPPSPSSPISTTYTLTFRTSCPMAAAGCEQPPSGQATTPSSSQLPSSTSPPAAAAASPPCHEQQQPLHCTACSDLWSPPIADAAVSLEHQQQQQQDQNQQREQEHQQDQDQQREQERQQDQIQQQHEGLLIAPSSSSTPTAPATHQSRLSLLDPFTPWLRTCQKEDASLSPISSVSGSLSFGFVRNRLDFSSPASVSRPRESSFSWESPAAAAAVDTGTVNKPRESSFSCKSPADAAAAADTGTVNKPRERSFSLESPAEPADAAAAAAVDTGTVNASRESSFPAEPAVAAEDRGNVLGSSSCSRHGVHASPDSGISAEGGRGAKRGLRATHASSSIRGGRGHAQGREACVKGLYGDSLSSSFSFADAESSGTGGREGGAVSAKNVSRSRSSSRGTSCEVERGSRGSEPANGNRNKSSSRSISRSRGTTCEAWAGSMGNKPDTGSRSRSSSTGSIGRGDREHSAPRESPRLGGIGGSSAAAVVSGDEQEAPLTFGKGGRGRRTAMLLVSSESESEGVMRGPWGRPATTGGKGRRWRRVVSSSESEGDGNVSPEQRGSQTLAAIKRRGRSIVRSRSSSGNEEDRGVTTGWGSKREMTDTVRTEAGEHGVGGEKPFAFNGRATQGRKEGGKKLGFCDDLLSRVYGSDNGELSSGGGEVSPLISKRSSSSRGRRGGGGFLSDGIGSSSSSKSRSSSLLWHTDVDTDAESNNSNSRGAGRFSRKPGGKEGKPGGASKGPRTEGKLTEKVRKGVPQKDTVGKAATKGFQLQDCSMWRPEPPQSALPRGSPDGNGHGAISRGRKAMGPKGGGASPKPKGGGASPKPKDGGASPKPRGGGFAGAVKPGGLEVKALAQGLAAAKRMAARAKREFGKQRQEIAAGLYAEWNALVFRGGLPANLPLVWNPRLVCTAGQVVDDGSMNRFKELGQYRQQRIPCRLELSPKVLDTEAKLRCTLAHEMCHVAAWAISREFEAPHGDAFKAWARAFEGVVPGLSITTCHSYQVYRPHRWQCTNTGCGRLYERTRLTIDIRLHACSQCHSRLVYLGKFTKAGQLAGKREGGTNNAYNMFVKDQFQQVKRSMPPGTPIAEVMRQIGSSWKEKKAAEEKLQQREHWQDKGWQQQHRGLVQMVVATAAAAPSLELVDISGSETMDQADWQVSGHTGPGKKADGSKNSGSVRDRQEDQGGVTEVLSFLERLDLTADE